ncbi:phage tail tape measure protein [Acinetobacter nosocomialis]|uniref:phage tail tape measure protein n=1 Tax=Acinetobacter nosocomialis TaxID=106654 RepID=UPI00237E7E40|nr:phage tail tape measure protein [Acinetobacter nosocomialis]MDE1703228.1 phage tail tape measure protein [Acinetobacter nosocomialis]HDG7211737.1 phage tail tape measure protein [Acinetobacter nosocomialis]
MAKNGVIRDFLVSLGFDTDNSGLANMKSAMDGIEWKAKALNGALMALATGAVVAVRQTASELDKLYFSSQRIGASVTNINAYGNAIAQLGGSADGAIGSLESLAEKIRNSPGYEGQLKSLGVTTRDANGAMRDRVEVMKDLSGVLAKMPAYQANAYANSLGIDQKTMLAMRDSKFIANMEKYQKIQKELGMNDDLAKSGNEFMTEYRDLTMMTKTGFQVIVMQAGKALIPILRLLNQLIQAGIHAFSQLNPQIKEGLAIGLRFAMLALIFGAMAKSLGLVLKFIPALKTFIGLLKLFRLAFLASPIGIILALGAALALLYDDYKTWREGGKSLFDWSKWTNGIDTIINKIKDFLDILNKVKDKTVEFVQKIIKDPAGALKEVATEVQQGVQNAKTAVQNYVNPTDPNKTTPTQEKVASSTQYVKSAIEKGVVAAAGIAKSTVEAVKGAVSTSTKSYSQNISNKRFTSDKAKSILKVAKEIGVDPNDLAAVISFETGGTFSPSVKNPNSSATGLIQFMEGSGGTKGKYYGMNRKKFSSLSFDEQMVYVEKYFKDRGFKSSKKRDVADLYTAVTGYGYKKGSKAYELNKVWDSNGDGYIAKGEMVQNKSFKAHQKNYYSQDDLSSFSQPVINNYGPPKGNPNKSDINASNLTSSNVTIYQSYQTDMTINGASNPIDSAKAVKRQQENSMVLMARNAKGIMV